jgi:glycosyltransferase involved in cell wall biosynthesis
MQRAAQEDAVLEVQQTPDALAAALVQLANAPQDRQSLGLRGQNHAWSVHSWPKIADLYMKTYTG